MHETLPHHVRQLGCILREAARFDVLHFHGDDIHFPPVRALRRPTVTTLHGALHAYDIVPLLDDCGHPPLVSVSHDQRRPAPAANWRRTIPHGLPRDLVRFAPAPMLTQQRRNRPIEMGLFFRIDARGDLQRPAGVARDGDRAFDPLLGRQASEEGDR